MSKDKPKREPPPPPPPREKPPGRVREGDFDEKATRNVPDTKPSVDPSKPWRRE